MTRKRILMYKGYYEPETAASMYLDTDAAEGLANHGYFVDLYVPAPTRGVTKQVHRLYSGKKVTKAGGNLLIHYFPLFREGKTITSRAARYILCNIIQFFKGLSARNTDVIFAGSTPPTTGAMCALLSAVKKVPLIYHMQDVFPDSLVSAGLTHKGSALWKLGFSLEKFTYRHADKILVISEDFRKNLLDKGVPAEKIMIVYNWIKTDTVYPVPRQDNPLFEELGLPRDKFLIVYAGNIGAAQNVGLLLDAAGLLRESQRVCFVIIGSGTQLENVKQKAAALPDGLVVFAPMQPYERVRFVYSLGDAGVVILRKGFGGSAMPSKTWSIMAAGTPVLASFDKGTQLERIITQHQCGVFAEAGSPENIADAVEALMGDKIRLEFMGQNARRFAREHLTREHAVSDIIRIIQAVCGEDEDLL